MDVRVVSELRETGFIKGAIWITLIEIEANIDKIPKDKKLHIYCLSGWRAKIAMSILVRNGFERIMITEDGGFEDMWGKKLIEKADF